MSQPLVEELRLDLPKSGEGSCFDSHKDARLTIHSISEKPLEGVLGERAAPGTNVSLGRMGEVVPMDFACLRKGATFNAEVTLDPDGLTWIEKRNPLKNCSTWWTLTSTILLVNLTSQESCKRFPSLFPASTEDGPCVVPCSRDILGKFLRDHADGKVIQGFILVTSGCHLIGLVSPSFLEKIPPPTQPLLMPSPPGSSPLALGGRLGESSPSFLEGKISKLRADYCECHSLTLGESFDLVLSSITTSPYSGLPVNHLRKTRHLSKEHVIPLVVFQFLGSAAIDPFNLLPISHALNQVRSSIRFGEFSAEDRPNFQVEGHHYWLDESSLTPEVTTWVKRELAKGKFSRQSDPFHPSTSSSILLPKKLYKGKRHGDAFILCTKDPCKFQPPLASRGQIARCVLWTFGAHLHDALPGDLGSYWLHKVIPTMVAWDRDSHVGDEEAALNRAVKETLGYSNAFIDFRIDHKDERRSLGEDIFMPPSHLS